MLGWTSEVKVPVKPNLHSECWQEQCHCGRHLLPSATYEIDCHVDKSQQQADGQDHHEEDEGDGVLENES